MKPPSVKPVLLLMLLYAAGYGLLCWQRFATFHCQIDMSYYLREVWGMGHGHPDLPLVRAPHWLGLHLEPVLFPLALLGKAGVPLVPLFLLLQAAAVAALAWPAYRLGLRHLQGTGHPGLAAFLVALGALLYPTVTVQTLMDFHPVTLALAPLLGVLDALDEGRPRRALWLGALSLCCREDVALQLAALAGVMAWSQAGAERRRWLGIGVLLLGYFLGYVLCVQPHWLPPAGSYGLHFSNVGGAAARSGRDLLLGALLHPLRLLAHLATADRLLYPVVLLWPVALLPLLAPRYLVGALPILAINLLSDFPRVRTLESHYTTAIVPFVIGPAIIGLGRAIDLVRKRGLPQLWPAPLILLLGLLLLSHYGHGGSPLARRSTRFAWSDFRPGPHHQAIRAAVRAVPLSASVAAPPGPLAHVAQRPRALSPPQFDDGKPVDVTIPSFTETQVTVIHFSDYHSHAVPGLARALAYVKQVKASRPDTLVLSGGDMLNAGTPAWSDKHRCVEWPWWNGLLDAMALGNHDLDYGWEAFRACQAQISYPVLSANLLGGKPYRARQVGGVKIGIFALAGPDFPRLVRPANLPPGSRFNDPLPVARGIVDALRTQEKVAAVIFIGHQDRESDFAMARAVPGIDLILGSHSHYKGEFQQVPGTATYFISPYQYLNYLSHVELSFAEGRLTGITGRLVRMDGHIAPDPEADTRIRALEAALEADPVYRDRFAVIGSAAVELSSDDLDRGESVLGNFVMDIVRGAAAAHAAFSSASSFRASILPGPIRMEDYLGALPYRNRILTFRLTGAQIQQLLDYSVSKRASDNFAVTSGLRYTVADGKAVDRDLDPAQLYDVATTDYLADVAAGYKDIFARAQGRRDTGLVVNDTVIDFIRRNSPVSARLEGRIIQR